MITRAVSEIHKEILTLVGADQVILPEKEVGIHLADRLSSPFIDLIRITKQFSISRLAAPKKLVGKKVRDMNLFENYGIYCIGIDRGDEIVSMSPDHVIMANDKLVFSGSKEDLEIKQNYPGTFFMCAFQRVRPKGIRVNTLWNPHTQATPWGSKRRNLTCCSCSLRERRSAHTEIANRELNAFIHFYTHRPLRCSPETGCASRSSLCLFLLKNYLLGSKIELRKSFKLTISKISKKINSQCLTKDKIQAFITSLFKNKIIRRRFTEMRTQRLLAGKPMSP